LEEHAEESLATEAPPEEHRRRIQPANMTKRQNQEVKQRTGMV
jgi:transposase-like protein